MRDKMHCELCKEKMKKIKMEYHYTEAGLNKVYLKDITGYECQKCGEIMPIIPNIKGLHRQIALNLINKKNLLSGNEMVFLRKEMRLKAKELAQLVGVHKVTVSRWENEREKISPACDRLIRMLYETKFIEKTCEKVKSEIDKFNLTTEISRMKRIFSTMCDMRNMAGENLKYIKNIQKEEKILIPMLSPFSPDNFWFPPNRQKSLLENVR
jgi:putative zinc finger/helix-turn-helix YgiT family protein